MKPCLKILMPPLRQKSELAIIMTTRQNLSQALRDCIARPGIKETMKVIGLTLQRMEAMESVVFKVEKEGMSFSMNGTLLFKERSSESLGERGIDNETNKKEETFLSKFAEKNIKEDIGITCSLDVVPNDTESSTEISSQYPEIVLAVVKLERYITGMKELNVNVTILKQIFMLLFFQVLESCGDEETKNIIKQDMIRVLGYNTVTSKRSLRVRLQKLDALGDLVRHFGKNIVLIPKLGIKVYYEMSEIQKQYIRENSFDLGDDAYERIIGRLQASSNFGAIVENLIRILPSRHRTPLQITTMSESEERRDNMENGGNDNLNNDFYDGNDVENSESVSPNTNTNNQEEASSTQANAHHPHNGAINVENSESISLNNANNHEEASTVQANADRSQNWANNLQTETNINRNNQQTHVPGTTQNANVLIEQGNNPVVASSSSVINPKPQIQNNMTNLKELLLGHERLQKETAPLHVNST